jgi:hypothetical protein
MAARMRSPAAEQAFAATRPKIDKANDPRNPIKRLETSSTSVLHRRFV